MRLDARASLGLVLVLTGIRSMSQVLGTFVQYVSYGDLSWEMLVVFLPFAMFVLQVGAGCAFAFGARRAGWILLSGYVAIAVGLGCFALVAMSNDLTTLATFGAMMEVLGTPLLALGLMLFGRPEGSSPRQELGALLIVYAVSSLVGTALDVIALLRTLLTADSSFDGVGPYIGQQALWWSAAVTIAVFQLRAGLALRRGAARAQRAVGVYAIVALIVEAAFLVLGVVTAMIPDEGRISSMLVGFRFASAVGSIAFPLVVWAFAKAYPVPPVLTAVPRAPVWMVVLVVPFLAIRPLFTEELVAPIAGESVARGLSVAFVALAATGLLASIASLRDRLSAAALFVAASLVGVATNVVIIVTLQTDGSHSPLQTGEFLSLTVALAVMAWLHRTTQPPVPRAVAR